MVLKANTLMGGCCYPPQLNKKPDKFHGVNFALFSAKNLTRQAPVPSAGVTGPRYAGSTPQLNRKNR